MDAAAPLTLDEAAEICLRGKVKSATLRAAASRGELRVMKKRGKPTPIQPRGTESREFRQSYLLCPRQIREGLGHPADDVEEELFKLGQEISPANATNIPRGFVYFIGTGEFVKIGFSTNFKRRLSDLQRGLPYKLEVYATVVGSIYDERELHWKFSDHRTDCGEWFRYADEIKAYVAELKVKR